MKFFVKRDSHHTFKSNHQTNLKAHIVLPDGSESFCKMFNSDTTKRANFRITKKTSRPICKICKNKYLEKNPGADIPGNENRSEQSSLF